MSLVDLHRSISGFTLLLLLSYYLGVVPENQITGIIVEVTTILTMIVFIAEGTLLLILALTVLGKIDLVFPIVSIFLGALSIKGIVNNDVLVPVVSTMIMFIFGYTGRGNIQDIYGNSQDKGKVT